VKTRTKLVGGAIALVLLLGAAAAVMTPRPVPIPSPSVGTVQRIAQFHSRFVPPRDVDVWLPPGFPGAGKYAVLYMQDGQMLFDPSITWNKQEWRADETAAALMAAGKVRPFIIVGVHNGGRDRGIEYFPQKPFESLPARTRAELGREDQLMNRRLMPAPVRSDDYLRFLVQELKPYIDAHYPVYTDAANTALLGSSMGGLISLYAISEYPQVFGGAACMSTHWTGTMHADEKDVPQAFFDYMGKHLPDPATHRIYFDHGTATIDAAYPALQSQADDVMRAKGYGDANWLTLRFQGAEHSENAWSARLSVPLLFLFGMPGPARESGVPPEATPDSVAGIPAGASGRQ
jgi:enterochelin esterase-like enzyme